MEYWVQVNNENPEMLYRIDKNKNVTRWINGSWKNSIFSYRDINLHGTSEKINPLTYEHPAFVKIQFYNEVLGGPE